MYDDEDEMARWLKKRAETADKRRRPEPRKYSVTVRLPAKLYRFVSENGITDTICDAVQEKMDKAAGVVNI